MLLIVYPVWPSLKRLLKQYPPLLRMSSAGARLSLHMDAGSSQSLPTYDLFVERIENIGWLLKYLHKQPSQRFFSFTVGYPGIRFVRYL